MEAITLHEIERRVAELAARIGASGALLPTYGRSEDGARPHIEVDSRGFHYVIVERGEELQRTTSRELDEILWHVFEGVTSALAWSYELANREHGKDARRLAFAHQLVLLGALSADWAERRRAQQRAILEQNPFDDGAIARLDFTAKLRDAGLSSEEAWRRACARYPLP